MMKTMTENNYMIIKKLLIEMAGQTGIVTIPRIFLMIFDGDYPNAVCLNQIIFWSDKGNIKLKNKGDGWFYKSYANWKQETGLSEYQLRRSFNLFKRMGFLETTRSKINGAPTLHFRFSLDSFLENLDNGTFKNSIFESEKIPDSMEPEKIPDSINSRGDKVKLMVVSADITKNSTKYDKESLEKTIEKRIKKEEDEGVEFPGKFKNMEFYRTWFDFQEHRRQIKSKMTQIAKTRMMKKLANEELRTAIEMMDESIANGWRGVFPPKNGNFAKRKRKLPEGI